jgi:predicted aldo/keto reductase-like oxidoreductase
MPVNPAEPVWRSFPATVLPEARSRGMGVIGMKVLCRGLGLAVPGCGTAEPWIRYALAHELSTIVIGCDGPQQVADNVAVASGAEPMTVEERRALEEVVAPYARQLMYYK